MRITFQDWMRILSLGTQQILSVCERIVKDYCQREDYERVQKWVFLLHQEMGLSFPPWVCAEMTGLSQQEICDYKACMDLKSTCSSCFWNMLSSCHPEMFEKGHVAQWPLWPSCHPVNFPKQCAELPGSWPQVSEWVQLRPAETELAQANPNSLSESRAQ